MVHFTTPSLMNNIILTINFYDLVIRLEFDNMNICLLPRESRLVLVIYGRTFNTESQDTSATISQTELGWASIQFFNVDGLVYNLFY